MRRLPLDTAAKPIGRHRVATAGVDRFSHFRKKKLCESGIDLRFVIRWANNQKERSEAGALSIPCDQQNGFQPAGGNGGCAKDRAVSNTPRIERYDICTKKRSNMVKSERIMQALGAISLGLMFFIIILKGYVDIKAVILANPHDVWRAIVRYILNNMAGG